MTAATPAQAAATASTEKATALAEQIGSAGTYRDDAGRMVVTVTDAADAAKVRAAGAVPRHVEHSLTDLQSATGALNAQARIPGTTWAIDPQTNRVEVTYDSTVSGTELAQLKSVTREFGDAVRVTSTPGKLSKLISGGQAIYTGGSRCSLGFNVRNSSGVQYFVTAGHCTNIGSNWYGPSSSTYLGYRTGTSFPGNDYGIVRYNSSSSRPGNVYLYNGSYRDITGSGNAYVNQYIYRSGSTTGLRGGYVTATNATVNYPQGTVYGLVRTNACAEGGDSGGSMFAGNTALGLTSGGSGNCTWGGTTYFQPVREALSRYGVAVY
ncbi:MAG: S1 family peptidase [Micromonosporaceae bacterium]